VSSDVQSIIELLGPREVIGQAIALLMATDDLSRDAAFAMLIRESSLSRRTVREVATEIVGQRGD
jgi:AmiR/NasT family two-component response regulator